MEADVEMSINNLNTRSVKSGDATEIHISATPLLGLSTREQAQQIFSGIREIVSSQGASIFQERIFATQGAFEMLTEVRAKEYGDLDDGVAPSLLVCKEGSSGAIVGVQVHAIKADTKLETIELDGTLYGRVIRIPRCTYMALTGISAGQFDNAADQSRAMLDKAGAMLKRFGGDIFSVPRTWMWLGDILSWYDDFNAVRNKFFTEQGALGDNKRSMPASTGIGLGPSNGAECSMDLTAVFEPKDSIEYLRTTGKQHCAYNYGSAFSRATRAITPAGETVFISGTASIDLSGATTNIDNPRAQIIDTIENVRAVLKEMQSDEKDLVQVMAYCKTAEVEEIFNGIKGDIDWPWITMICDVCRDNLLFEIEAMVLK